MGDAARPCETHPALVDFHHGLPRLKAALRRQRKVRIVAIGSSSTAGVDPVLPYPPRLEMLLRKRFFGSVIDVVNRGISGQESPEEISRFQPDVFDEAPVLVIWQVGTNAIYRDYNPAEVAAAIEVGLQWLAGTTDVILMDLQYTGAMVDKIKASENMVSLISAAAARAGVDVFRRFALMRRWVEDGIPIAALEDGADTHLHTGEWATNCITHALFGAIERALAQEDTT